MNTRRLRKLESFLRKLPQEQWNFAAIVAKVDPKTDCGTVCCAIGWMPKVAPRSWKWDEGCVTYLQTNMGPFMGAAAHFGIDAREAVQLFTYTGLGCEFRSPYYLHRNSAHQVVPVDVADAINKFIKNGGL